MARWKPCLELDPKLGRLGLSWAASRFRYPRLCIECQQLVRFSTILPDKSGEPLQHEKRPDPIVPAVEAHCIVCGRRLAWCSSTDRIAAKRTQAAALQLQVNCRAVAERLKVRHHLFDIRLARTDCYMQFGPRWFATTPVPAGETAHYLSYEVIDRIFATRTITASLSFEWTS
jgi:hypothetical protein